MIIPTPKQIPDKLQARINGGRMSTIAMRAEVVNKESRIIRHRISTITPDSYGTVFLPDGCDFTRFDKNPMVLWLHGRDNSMPKLPIAKNIGHETNETEVWATTQFNTIPFSLQLCQLCLDDDIRGWSIGFDPIDGIFAGSQEFNDLVQERNLKGDFDLVFTKYSLIEYSLVPIPSNPDALTRALESGKVTDIALRNSLIRAIDGGRGLPPRISTIESRAEEPVVSETEDNTPVNPPPEESYVRIEQFEKQGLTIRQLIADVQAYTQRLKGQIDYLLGEQDKLKSQLARREVKDQIPDFGKMVRDAIAEASGRLPD
jgi:hypothetical protein